ncbi:MAG TPA: aminodeoxychorismate lyase [Porticoccaceae bacterium]|nr:aminodeoxychorismate lyase [Porticoccaceae bacterium]
MHTLLIDGVPATAHLAHDRALQFGHGLFETMCLWQGAIPLLERHLARLARGAEVLGIAYQEDLIRRHLHSALEHFPADGVVKLVLTAGIGKRGYRYCLEEGVAEPRCLLYFFERPPQQVGIALQVCDYRLPQNPRLAGIKHLNRLDQVLAAVELADEKEGLLLDSSGNVIEALSSNIFLYCHGQWLSPQLNNAGVAGVMRALLLERVLPLLGKAVQCRDVTLVELAAADEIFICNAVRGIIPVESISGELQWSPRGGAALCDNSRDLQIELNRLYPCFAV